MTAKPTGTSARRTVFQTSLISALLDGVYEGEMTVGELLTHGDFGLGTFNSLDGEMIVIASECYRLRVGGQVTRVPNDELVPFAIVTAFVPDLELEMPRGLDKAALAGYLTDSVPSVNFLYAAKLAGTFKEVAIRNVQKQERPYRPLADVTRGEPVQVLADVSGVMAGFQTPAYERGIGVPGGHLHFIDKDRSSGGHVLDFTAGTTTLELSIGTDLVVSLPTTPTFMGADLTPEDLDQQVESAENHGPTSSLGVAEDTQPTS